MGWAVAEVYVDDDISAYSGKRRPAYERMLADVEAGRIDAIVAWAADRLTRTPLENERIIELADKRGTKLATVTGEYDLSTPTGKLHFRMLGSIARYESEQRGLRIRLERQQAAEAGKPHSGGYRAFGFERDGSTIRETEADLIRVAADRLLDGEALGSIASSWTAQGVTTPSGRPWRVSTVRRMLTSPRLAGRRVHRGVETQATWEPILDADTFERVRLFLADPTRYTGGGRLVRTHLLTGLVVCGLCGTKLEGSPNRGAARYACKKRPHGGCGRIVRKAASVEDYVQGEAFTRMDRLKQPVTQPGPEALEAVREIDQRLELIADLLVDGTLRKPEYQRQKERLERKRAEAQQSFQVSTARYRLVLFLDSQADIRLSWPKETLQWRRSIIESLVERVIVHPSTAKQGDNRFLGSDIEIVWRELS